MIKDNNILITGGTGSLGKSLIQFLLNNDQHRPKTIKILSRDEDKQYWINNYYKDTEYYSRLQFIIGDIRSFSTLVGALQNVDIVVHAAAMKQVPACESFPYEAVQTNIIGANNITSAIIQYGLPIKKVIGISTDKACDPVNVYGMTKFIQEKIFLAANSSIKSTDFIMVRYGNVLASRGSVIPLFKEQIKNGGPITLTDANMTRFFFSLDDAIHTIISASSDINKGDILVPKIKSFSIANIAKIMSEQSNIPIVHTGPRTGEKLHETLISKNEIDRTSEKVINSKTYFIINSDANNISNQTQFNNAYTSAENINTLEETYQLLKTNNLL